MHGAEVTGALWSVALAVSCWIAAVLLINEVPDRQADAAAGKRTLAVRLSARGTAILFEAIKTGRSDSGVVVPIGSRRTTLKFTGVTPAAARKVLTTAGLELIEQSALRSEPGRSAHGSKR